MLKCNFLRVQLKWIISGIGVWVLTTVHVWWKLQSKISSEHIADSLQQIFFKKTNLFVIRALDQIVTIGGKVLLTGWRVRPMMKCNFLSLPQWNYCYCSGICLSCASPLIHLLFLSERSWAGAVEEGAAWGLSRSSTAAAEGTQNET